MRILIKIPRSSAKVKSIPEDYVYRCPYCKSSLLVRYGRRLRHLRDPEVKYVTVQRWKCLSCNKTFTQRPEGVSRFVFSEFIVSLVVFLYTLGLSYGNASKVLIFFKLSIDQTTVWRYVQRIGKRLREKKAKGRYSIAGFDQTYVRIKGIKRIVNMFFSTDGILLD